MIHTKFTLGEIHVTNAAQEALLSNRENIETHLQRHASCDWGNVSPEDKAKNDLAWQKGLEQDRVTSQYKLPFGPELKIVTEWDRSMTTIMLVEEA